MCKVVQKSGKNRCIKIRRNESKCVKKFDLSPHAAKTHLVLCKKFKAHAKEAIMIIHKANFHPTKVQMRALFIV